MSFAAGYKYGLSYPVILKEYVGDILILSLAITNDAVSKFPYNLVVVKEMRSLIRYS